MLSFRHPTTILIAGPTQAGKSFFFKQILDQNLIQPPPNRIIYVYSDSHPHLNDSVEYVIGIKNVLPILPSIDPSERNLIVLDDQMSEGGSQKRQPTYSPKGPIIKT